MFKDIFDQIHNLYSIDMMLFSTLRHRYRLGMVVCMLVVCAIIFPNFSYLVQMSLMLTLLVPMLLGFSYYVGSGVYDHIKKTYPEYTGPMTRWKWRTPEFEKYRMGLGAQFLKDKSGYSIERLKILEQVSKDELSEMPRGPRLPFPLYIALILGASPIIRDITTKEGVVTSAYLGYYLIAVILVILLTFMCQGLLIEYYNTPRILVLDRLTMIRQALFELSSTPQAKAPPEMGETLPQNDFGQGMPTGRDHRRGGPAPSPGTCVLPAPS